MPTPEAPQPPLPKKPGGRGRRPGPGVKPGGRRRYGTREAGWEEAARHGLPLLVPSGPRSTVHSSMVPKGSNIFRTSSSVCCFPSIPTKSFRSSRG